MSYGTGARVFRSSCGAACRQTRTHQSPGTRERIVLRSTETPVLLLTWIPPACSSAHPPMPTDDDPGGADLQFPEPPAQPLRWIKFGTVAAWLRTRRPHRGPPRHLQFDA